MTIHLSATGFELNGKLEKYTHHKLERVVRHLPRAARAGVSCAVHFTQSTRKGGVVGSCSITLNVGDALMKAEEATQHMYTALDIAAVHIERQLNEYRLQHRRHLVHLPLRRLHP